MVGHLAVRNNAYVPKVHVRYTLSHPLIVLPYKRHIPSIIHLTTEEKTAFAQILSQLTIRYDNLFSCSFAYSMGIHQRPTPPSSGVTPEDQDEENIAHLHLHFAPPLLRSASVRKFLVGCVIIPI